MKWFVSAIAFLAVQVVSVRVSLGGEWTRIDTHVPNTQASPLEKRAGVNDVANVGYATLNGG